MAITQVSYARLYNTGNYENVRFEVVASVEDGDVEAAFTEANEAVHAEHAYWLAEREAEAKAAQLEREAARLATAQSKRGIDLF